MNHPGNAFCVETAIVRSQHMTLGESLNVYLVRHFNSVPKKGSMICKKHLLEAKRNSQSLDHIPIWKRNEKGSSITSTDTCINPKCKTSHVQKLIKPMFAPIETLTKILGIQSSARPIVQCRKCYNDTYTIVVGTRLPCSSCGTTPKPGTVFCQHSPNAAVVSQYLKTTGHNVEFQPTDCVCLTCYKVHCSILEKMKSEGTDDMLKQDIVTWVSKLGDINVDKLSKAILESVVYVANQLLLCNAVSNSTVVLFK